MRSACDPGKSINSNMPDQQHFEETAAFIREHRSNELNFEKLAARLEEERRAGLDPELGPVMETEGAAYRQARETRASAWPEFERFVSAFEKAVLAAAR
ncbi:MAG: hypothetical protein JWP27_42 [Flaviaesturariibacter sp.]|nr:hypothetical protein [Flaviaesturariibacter sp.]